MTMLKRVVLKIGIDSPELPKPEPFDSRLRDTFDLARGDKVSLEDLGHCVRISGKHGVQRVSWSYVIEAWEADQPSTETAQAAASTRARGAK